MRTSGIVLFGLTLALLAVAASAQTTIVTLTLPQEVITNPLAQLSLIPAGAGFDREYARLMYQQNYDIATIANLGSQRAAYSYLGLFSDKVRDERLNMNKKLASWYPRLSGGQAMTVSPSRAQAIVNWLSQYSGVDFDAAYAVVMARLTYQSEQAANLAKQRAVTPDLRDQAKTAARTNQNETKAFQRWLKTGFLTLYQESRYCSNFFNYWDPRCPSEYKHPGFFYKSW